MNITVSINKEFGELTDKKIERIASNFPELNNVQNMDSQIVFFQMENQALILNKVNNEIAVAFPSDSILETSVANLLKLLDLLDLDNEGICNITIENVEESGFSVANASKNLLGLNDETDGVGLRLLIDTFSDYPKEIKVEPRIDDFEKLYVSCVQTQKVSSELTKEFVENSVEYLLEKLEQYKKIYLEKGGEIG